MREAFTRESDGSLLNIEIEMDAGIYKNDNPWLVSVFVKYDGLDDSSESYEEFLETKESLIIGIEYEDKAKYLGARIVDGWSEFYFCASSAKDLNTMVTAMLKDTGYAYRFAYEDIADTPDAGVIYSWIRIIDLDVTSYYPS